MISDTMKKYGMGPEVSTEVWEYEVANHTPRTTYPSRLLDKALLSFQGHISIIGFFLFMLDRTMKWFQLRASGTSPEKSLGLLISKAYILGAPTRAGVS